MEQGGSQNLIKAGPILRPVPFRSRGVNLAEGNRGPGLYSRKYGIMLDAYKLKVLKTTPHLKHYTGFASIITTKVFH